MKQRDRASLSVSHSVPFYMPEVYNKLLKDTDISVLIRLQDCNIFQFLHIKNLSGYYIHRRANLIAIHTRHNEHKSTRKRKQIKNINHRTRLWLTGLQVEISISVASQVLISLKPSPPQSITEVCNVVGTTASDSFPAYILRLHSLTINSAGSLKQVCVQS